MPTTTARRAIWLLAPPTAICLLDYSLTLAGQSSAYWSGDYTAVNEVSPSFAYYLTVHPLAAMAAGVLWIAIFSAIILLLPEMLALIVSIAILFGHTFGALSWLMFRFHSYQACNLLFLVSATLVVYAFKKGQSNEGRSAIQWERTGLPEWSRWLVIATFATVPIWWFLIPR